jgi:hypothetical protein
MSLPTAISKSTIGFLQAHLCERGTSVAMYDYARAHSRTGTSIIFYNPNHPANRPRVVEKFRELFRLIPFSSMSEVEEKIESEQISYLYVIKYGYPDQYISSKVPTLVHSVFVYHPHGRYASVSEKIAYQNKGVWLPHVVNPLPLIGREAFRSRFGIPTEAYVYGRHGGKDTFSISYVKEAIVEIIDTLPAVWFVFVNTTPFCSHARVLFLDELITDAEKGEFISACDAMIHARVEGETFGLACAEFGISERMILTSPALSTDDNQHIFLGGDRVKIYRNKGELLNLIQKYPHNPPSTENPYKRFTADRVMPQFYRLLE